MTTWPISHVLALVLFLVLSIAPRMKKRTALLRKLKAIFRRYQSQPMGRVTQLINPILRGGGHLLCHRRCEPLLRVRPRLGGKEDTAAPDAGTETSGLRLEEVE